MEENENNQDSNDLFYGNNAGTSGRDISDADLALLEKSNSTGVTVHDGDDLVEVNPDEEAEDTPDEPKEDEAGKKPVETPKDAPLGAQIAESQKELDEIGEDLKAKGVDVEAILADFTKTGTFTEESYEALAKAGYSKGAVNAIVKGQVALAQEATRALFTSVGGEENFMALSEFAVANDPESVEAFNEAQNRGDVKTAQVILKGIERAHKARFGTANKQLSGRPAAAKTAQATAGFSTKQEMVKAMSDNRYGKDLAYTRQVEQKVANAPF